MKRVSRRIFLTRSKSALVDWEDYDWLSHHNWSTKNGKQTFYAHARIDGRTVMMHRALVAGGCIDHINGNGLDNRRVNLRAVTMQMNARNRRPGRRNASGTVGVSQHGGKWLASITTHGIQKHLGIFADLDDAIVARKAAENRCWGVRREDQLEEMK